MRGYAKSAGCQDSAARAGGAAPNTAADPTYDEPYPEVVRNFRLFYEFVPLGSCRKSVNLAKRLI